MLFLLSTTNYVTLVLVGLAIIGVAYSKITGKKIRIADAFENDFSEVIEIFATVSTLMEVIALSYIAIERGIDPVVAFTRYGLIGFIELAMTFLFLSTTQKVAISYLEKITADNKVTLKEHLFFYLKLISFIPLFVFCSLPTYAILQLYYESIGALKFIFVHNWNPFKQLIPFDVKYAEDKMIFPELAAVLIIAMTPIINIIKVVMFIFQDLPNYVKKMKLEMEELEAEELEDDDFDDEEYEDDYDSNGDDGDFNEAEDSGSDSSANTEATNGSHVRLENTSSSMTRQESDMLDNTVKTLCDIYNKQESYVYRKLNEAASASEDVVNGSTSVTKALLEIVNILQGSNNNSNPTLINGYNIYNVRVASMSSEVSTNSRDVIRLKTALANSPRQERSAIEDEIERKQRGRAKLEDDISRIKDEKLPKEIENIKNLVNQMGINL